MEFKGIEEEEEEIAEERSSAEGEKDKGEQNLPISSDLMEKCKEIAFHPEAFGTFVDFLSDFILSTFF